MRECRCATFDMEYFYNIQNKCIIHLFHVNIKEIKENNIVFALKSCVLFISIFIHFTKSLSRKMLILSYEKN